MLQDHQAFRRKNWKYLILDEAQNIKNFKSQRWQSLLNFNRWVPFTWGGWGRVMDPGTDPLMSSTASGACS